ncbi:MAG TPA: hypothetical protein DCR27_06580 [Lachnospiraceae bacterium]|nr:hypothetical protein [Lachnospiraceae bacterium]
MQPYFLPYLSYWQLIAAVDRFVILDDVNFIKRGFINRNRILINGQPYLFSVPIKKASQNHLIKDTQLCFDEKEKRKFLVRIENAYRRAPFFGTVMPLVRRITEYEENDLTEYITNSIKEIMSYLGLGTVILKSSQMKKDNSYTGAERIMEICGCLGGDVYINLIGGKKLYRHDIFAEHGISLYFLATRFEQIQYRQFGTEFQEKLSILDVLMFNPVNEVKDMLQMYELEE